MVAHDTIHVMHPCAAGPDVHKMQVTAAVRRTRPDGKADTDTRVISALPNGIAEMTGWLAGHGVTAAAMEATGIYWYSVHDALTGAGIESRVVDAQHVKQLKGRKTDVADAMWLSRIATFGLCSPSFVPTAEMRELRDLSHKRRKIVGARARLRNQIHQIVDRAGIRIGGILTDLFGRNGLRILEGLARELPADEIVDCLTRHVSRHRLALRDALGAGLGDIQRFMLDDLLDAWYRESERIARYDELLEAGLSEHGTLLDLLVTIPGIDRTAAAAILVELGPDMDQFPSARHCAAWAGICPGNNESAGKRRSGSTRKGATSLRSVLVDHAHAAARTKDCQFSGYHKALTVRRGYKRATVATAHKMLRIVYAMPGLASCTGIPRRTTRR